MRFAHMMLVSVLSMAMSACSLNNLLEGTDPPIGESIDPREVSTYAGAVGVYRGARSSMEKAISATSQDVAIFTDELSALTGGPIQLDGRDPNDGAEGIVSNNAYALWQETRVRAAQASVLLLRYGTPVSRPLVGHAYAMQAHAIMMLAETMCSGIPLTTVPFEGGMQLSPAIPTTALLERAVALFDTAIEYGSDSLPIATFARVGKGRALLSLGKYAEAEAAVAGVPTTSQYRVQFAGNLSGTTLDVPFWTDTMSTSSSILGRLVVLNREGSNGMVWVADSVSRQDPRVPMNTVSPTTFAVPFRQVKFTSPMETVTIADGIQARMIEAETQLQPANAPHGPWLTTLNNARATVGLGPLDDPGSASERIDLLFRERAFWFYLTGQRLGDMRRLVRFYGRLPNQVYAAGIYPVFNYATIAYEDEYVFVPPQAERDNNPLYKGCIDKRP